MQTHDLGVATPGSTRNEIAITSQERHWRELGPEQVLHEWWHFTQAKLELSSKYPGEQGQLEVATILLYLLMEGPIEHAVHWFDKGPVHSPQE